MSAYAWMYDKLNDRSKCENERKRASESENKCEKTNESRVRRANKRDE